MTVATMLRSVLTVFALIAALSCPVLAVDGMIEPTVQPLDMRSLQRPEGDGAHDSGHCVSGLHCYGTCASH